MIQKVLKVGDSAAVIIPKKSLEELRLKIGDRISIEVEKDKRRVIIQPKEELSKKDLKIAELTLDFINRYRKDLEALARK